MKIENIDIETTIAKARTFVREDKELSAATKSIVEILILIITLLANRLNLNSTNSSKPPSNDPNRKKRSEKTGKKAGGQKGHVGTTRSGLWIILTFPFQITWVKEISA